MYGECGAWGRRVERGLGGSGRASVAHLAQF